MSVDVAVRAPATTRFTQTPAASAGGAGASDRSASTAVIHSGDKNRYGMNFSRMEWAAQVHNRIAKLNQAETIERIVMVANLASPATITMRSTRCG